MQVTLMDFGVLYRRLDASKVLSKNPTLIGTVLGTKWYEHPTLGDEAGMIVIDLNGHAFQTDWHDLPRDCDLLGELHV